MEITKTCKLCEQTKELGQFNFANKAKLIYKPHCKACDKKLNKERYLQNLESSLESSRHWKTKHSDKIKEYNKNYYERTTAAKTQQ